MIKYKDSDGDVFNIAGNYEIPIPEITIFPIGAIFPFMSDIIPDNFLLCNGATFDANEYPELYSVLGTNKVPDLREVALVGAGQNSTYSIATHDVFTVGQFKDDALQTHTHTYNGYGPGKYEPTGQGSLNAHGQSASTNTNANNGRTATVTRGKRKGVYYIIRAKI